MPASLRGFGPLGLAAIALILAGNFLFALALIYWNLEAPVAHLFFK